MAEKKKPGRPKKKKVKRKRQAVYPPSALPPPPMLKEPVTSVYGNTTYVSTATIEEGPKEAFPLLIVSMAPCAMCRLLNPTPKLRVMNLKPQLVELLGELVWQHVMGLRTTDLFCSLAGQPSQILAKLSLGERPELDETSSCVRRFVGP